MSIPLHRAFTRDFPTALSESSEDDDTLFHRKRHATTGALRDKSHEADDTPEDSANFPQALQIGIPESEDESNLASQYGDYQEGCRQPTSYPNDEDIESIENWRESQDPFIQAGVDEHSHPVQSCHVTDNDEEEYEEDFSEEESDSFESIEDNGNYDESDPDSDLIIPEPHITSFDYCETPLVGSDELLEILLYKVKCEGNASLSTHRRYCDVMKGFTKYKINSDRRTVEANMDMLTGLRHTRYSACKNGCCAYTGSLAKDDKCVCGLTKDIIHTQTFDYISLIHRLRLWYSTPNRAHELKNYVKCLEPADGLMRDIWDGELIKNLRGKGFFVSGVPAQYPQAVIRRPQTLSDAPNGCLSADDVTCYVILTKNAESGNRLGVYILNRRRRAIP